MRSPRLLWEAYRLARDVNARPSQLYGLDDYEAWCFDRAAWTFGQWVEGRVRQVAGKAKNQKAADARASRELRRILETGPDAPSGGRRSSGRFRDPAAGSPTVGGGGRLVTS